MRIDPVEKTKRYRQVAARADEMARARLLASGLNPDSFGACHAIWAEKKQILREEFGIDWRTPDEMNPDVLFD
jgi:hypothetical protein